MRKLFKKKNGLNIIIPLTNIPVIQKEKGHLFIELRDDV